MRAAFDTNVLAYAEGIGDDARCHKARQLVADIDPAQVILPVQTLGELYRVLTGKAKQDPNAARSAVLSWADSFELADSTWTAFQSAFDLAADHQLQIWDALILAVAAESQCRLLISEDLQNGFTWRGVTVVDPFVEPRSKLLETMLK